MEAVTQPGFERALGLVVSVRDELGQMGRKTLVSEVMGRHSNTILIDEVTGKILDAIKRYGHAVSRYRRYCPVFPTWPHPGR